MDALALLLIDDMCNRENEATGQPGKPAIYQPYKETYPYIVSPAALDQDSVYDAYRKSARVKLQALFHSHSFTMNKTSVNKKRQSQGLPSSLSPCKPVLTFTPHKTSQPDQARAKQPDCSRNRNHSSGCKNNLASTRYRVRRDTLNTYMLG